MGSCNSTNSTAQPVPDVKEKVLLDTTAIALKTFLDWEKLPKSEQIIMDILLSQPNGSFPTANDCIQFFHQLGERFSVHNKNDNSKQEAVVFAGSFRLVVSIMRKWPENVDVQRYGIFCLGRIVGLEYCKVPEIVTMLTESGAREAVVWAMEQYPSNNDVQYQGVFMLANSFAVTDRTLALHIAITNELNGVGLIVAAMTNFPNNVRTQGFACFFMWKLAHHEELKEQLVQSGVRRLLLKAIETHENGTLDAADDIKNFGKKALIKLLP